MKKNYAFYTLSILASLLIISSCNKEDLTEEKDEEESVTMQMIASAFAAGATTYDGEIGIVNDKSQTVFYGLGGGSFSFSGVLPKTIPLSSFTIKNYTLPINQGVFYGGNMYDTTGLKNRENDFWGQTNTLKLNGTSLGQGIYLPKPVSVTFSGANYTISKASGVTLSFQDDLNYSNNVIVVLQYIPDMTGNDLIKVNHPNLITKQFMFADDAGSFTIASSDLVDFPAGARVLMYLGRGTSQVYNYSGKSIKALALNITTLPNISLTQ